MSGYSLTLRNHDVFSKTASFQNIIDIYSFDHELRHILLKYLEIIVSSLNKNGLLKSVRGKNGGYMLNREPKEYTIASILNAAEGSLAPVACVSDGDCENAPSCKTYVLWKELDDVIEDFLSSKTLADIL